ncbi:hypothetical protein Fmac_005605 [Flemingia macrophylla]|uniref:Ubiquitin-like protease family profile domain-containing protein n=1 Tax=Flemingia macrophylla TaxID=520843 RepID=A0ABD1N8C0_9FABA
MEEQRHQPEGPAHLDWNRLLDGSQSPPRELVVVQSSTMASDQPPADDVLALPDHKLKDSIQSMKRTLEEMRMTLPDNGAKLYNRIDRFQQELTRRELKRRRQEDDEDQKPQSGQATSSNAVNEGVSNKLREEIFLSQSQPQSAFAFCFGKKLEDNQTNCIGTDACRKEMSHFNQKIQDNGEHRRRKKLRSSSRKSQFKCTNKLSKRDTFGDGRTCRATSTLSLRIGRNQPRFYPKNNGRRDASQAIQLDGSRSRKGPHIVLDDDDDEDEAHIVEKTENKYAEYLKEAKIYFPSRDDPECVEIRYTDTNCLAPEGYLTSTIMNFYIQYLQQQALLTNKSLSDYHFFNTYFYKKLKEAVSYKQSDREMIFAKFRRWWKGVNIFQKAYVLIPIHEDLHWSLIIVCIPDKEDESGPIILHLDSLGLHSSKSVFDNIKSYLIEEKNYMDREGASSDVSIANRIWKSLARRIESQIIAVPQQKNEYDCGIFVLYFIKRFVEEAPPRLKKNDLDMVGKRWFKPEEASNLRVKIRKLLIEKLQNSMKKKCISESSSAGCANDCVETPDDSLT